MKDEEAPQLPDFPLSDPTSPSFESARTISQDWPFRLGWMAYDQEISASEQILALQQLISQPRCSNQDFIEEGLHLIDHTLTQYFKVAMSFIHEKHKNVVNAVVPGWVLTDYALDQKINSWFPSSGHASFGMLSEGRIKSYQQLFSMAFRLMLRFLYTVLTGDASQFGLFKLRGTEMQFEAIIGLYRLFAEHAGGVIPEDELHWAMHNVLVTLLWPQGLEYQTIDCPTDQAIFLWALLPNGQYRIPGSLLSLLAECKFGFCCTAIHLAQVEVYKQQNKELITFYGSLLEDRRGTNDEWLRDDNSDIKMEDISEGKPIGQPDTANDSINIPTVLNKLRNIALSGESNHSLVGINTK
jgi:hypothetical protein